MRAGWIWGTALILYGAFSLWYNNLGGPLSPAEIEVYAERFQASGSDPERQAAAYAGMTHKVAKATGHRRHCEE